MKHATGQENISVKQMCFNDKDITDKKEITESFNEPFVTVGKKLAKQIPCSGVSPPTEHIPKSPLKSEFQLITEAQVLKIITKLAKGKATGLHDVPSRALKNCAEKITPSLSYIFNLSVRTRVFPDDFKIARVAPVFKNGDIGDPGNYRPISVLPTIARVFEKLIYNQLYSYFLNNRLLGNEQYGFRSLHSTALALGKTSNSWLMDTDDGKMNSVVFLDIKQAFDTVDHQLMLDKLKCYGIHEDELAFFVSYLSDRQQCCNVSNVFSSTRKITCGVSQGSILGPLLFIIYMNDLPVSVTGVDIKMYADDTSLFRAFKTINDLQELR